MSISQSEYIPIPKSLSESSDLCYIVEGISISLVFYLFYIELAPGMGGILFRPWSDGKIHFNPLGALPLMKYPFQSTEFWKPDFWDLNFITFASIGTLIYYTFRKYIDLLQSIQDL